MLTQILQDAFFAAIAAIGFAAISKPPRRAYLYCALTAAIGHSCRMVLMAADINIVVASFLAALLVGLAAVLLSPVARMPAETCLFPALLPMIPGIYAYKAFGALAMCVLYSGQPMFDHTFYLFASNALICVAVILALVLGATSPVFMLKKISFRATR
ncbi:MAG: threonine/serine exporter family protein [Muribaculaceae bacterium]|nr:threonine/serine exporter family protein [Muribaculaceae bacterium]